MGIIERPQDRTTRNRGDDLDLSENAILGHPGQNADVK